MCAPLKMPTLADFIGDVERTTLGMSDDDFEDIPGLVQVDFDDDLPNIMRMFLPPAHVYEKYAWFDKEDFLNFVKTKYVLDYCDDNDNDDDVTESHDSFVRKLNALFAYRNYLDKKACDEASEDARYLSGNAQDFVLNTSINKKVATIEPRHRTKTTRNTQEKTASVDTDVVSTTIVGIDVRYRMDKKHRPLKYTNKLEHVVAFYNDDA